MKYFFILGRHAELSISEIEARLNQQKTAFELLQKGLDFLILETKIELDTDDLIKKLGGTIKIGQIVAELPKISAEKLVDLIPTSDKKIYFGFSLHGFQFNLTKLGLETKKLMKENDLKVRFVTSQENPLSSVIVQKNHLLDGGAELVLMKTGTTYTIGRTLCVQPFELLSKLDYGRPARDSFSGMLPPKLAQIMINLSDPAPKGLIYDPFCGSGTILQQGLVLGYNVMGSDISPKAVQDSKENLNWLASEISLKSKYSVFQSDITRQAQLGMAVDTIVTEPYLGPALRGHEKKDEIDKNIQNLIRLYKTSLQKFAEWLKPSGVVVMIVPKFLLDATPHTNEQLISINLINLLPPRLKFVSKWEYAREGQHVIREIYKLQKI
ncbi:MAG: hypothetical protein UT32_C0022G0006 [Parcubacteria group bacterium GW2011_GWC2_39_14]|nr:MAG: hypothetical protein UT32_C0022G0006 [Parcubacteria group bacterium GW2011_GWC2_39_14]KKR53812.1 MAG: hypothetical protein UT91_C0023G0006 [Parcubacteria group bacterium GW2011_GWA2_40_23]